MLRKIYFRKSMLTGTDERKGVVKTEWKNVRDRLLNIEPQFTKLVDELNLDHQFPLFLVYFPWGMLKGDTDSPFLPYIEGGYYRLSDPQVPKDISKHLAYGKSSSPMGIILEKNFEVFIDLKDEMLSIPWEIYSPGTIFSINKTLNRKNEHKHNTNNILNAISGVRSLCMLPHIGCATNHIFLQRQFNIKSSAPKFLYNHWQIFKEIIQSKALNCDWRSCLIYFPEKFVEKLHNDKSWLSLKSYMHEVAWKRFAYERNRIYYDIAFSLIQKKRHLKPNPYLTDTAKHLFSIALGAVPGYSPAINEESLPLSTLQEAFIQTYKLEKYFPTILQPMHFSFSKEKFPIYYSMQYPSVSAFAPKSRKTTNTLFEMRELEHIIRIFLNELKKTNSLCSDTLLHQVVQQIEFNFFHNEKDPHQIIQNSNTIPNIDRRLRSKNMSFAGDAKFLRGCVSIRTKN